MNGKYYLTNDIIFLDEYYEKGGMFYSNNGGKGWEPIGYESRPFTGVLDGNGHSIVNLKIESTYTYVGILGYSTGTIENLTIENCIIVGDSINQKIGSIVGGVSRGVINNCHVSGYVSSQVPSSRVISSNFYNYIGGIVGYITNSTISNCSSSATVSSVVSSGHSKYANVTKGQIYGYSSNNAITN